MSEIKAAKRTEWFVDIVDGERNVIVSVFRSCDYQKAHEEYLKWKKGLTNPNCIYFTVKPLDVKITTVEEPIVYNDFQNTLYEAFVLSHLPGASTDRHTINELLFILNQSNKFVDMNINISIKNKEAKWYCIPSLDCFVPITYRQILFDISKVEYEREIVGTEFYDNITIYESEVF